MFVLKVFTKIFTKIGNHSDRRPEAQDKYNLKLI